MCLPLQRGSMKEAWEASCDGKRRMANYIVGVAAVVIIRS